MKNVQCNTLAGTAELARGERGIRQRLHDNRRHLDDHVGASPAADRRRHEPATIETAPENGVYPVFAAEFAKQQILTNPTTQSARAKRKPRQQH